MKYGFGYVENPDGPVGILAAIAAAIVFVMAPVLGAICDQAARRLPFLVVSTVLCVSATFFLAQAAQGLSFILFVVAVVAFQAGLIFYDSLLRRSAPTKTADGSAASASAWVPRLPPGIRHRYRAVGRHEGVSRGRGLTSRCSAASPSRFLVFALPAFVFVRERPRAAPPLSWRVAPWRSAAGLDGPPGTPLPGAAASSCSGACSMPTPPTR